MREKIKGSLYAKVFLITLVMLFGLSLLVFGLLAWLMPQTYSNKLNALLDEQTLSFLSELEKVAFADSGSLFDQFARNMEIYSMELYDENGVFVPLPSAQTSAEYGERGLAGYGEAGYAGNGETSHASDGGAGYAGYGEAGYTAGYGEVSIALSAEDDFGEDTPVLCNQYYFSFADSEERYMLLVYGKAGQIAELQQAFLRVFPLLSAVILLVSLMISWIYSRMITKPVLEISRVSEQMSDLHLEWQVDGQRTDELGTLGKSLNRLSQNLRGALNDLQKANAELEADIEREKALEQAQIDFFAAASHELKTPITVIKGQLEGMLLGIGAYKDREKYLLRSLGVTQTLESMVYDLLTISRLQASDSGFKTEKVDCASVVRKYLADTEDLIAGKDLQINCHFPDSVLIDANKILMEKVFSNLIGNAVKYAPPEASVHITVRERQGSWLFSIENTGTHIPEEAIPKLFEAFYRVDTSRSRQTGGSGLGLYIVQKILQQHDSRCDVRNTEDGVEFFFELPNRT